MLDRRTIRERHARYGDTIPKSAIVEFYEEMAWGLGSLDTAAREIHVATLIACNRPKGWRTW